MTLSRGNFALIAFGVLLVGLGVGGLIGYFARSPDAVQDELMTKLTTEADPSIKAKLLDEIKADNIREYLRELTATPQLAGTPADEEQADLLVKFWEDQGIKAVKVPYDVLLSYPDKDDPNRIELQDGSGKALFTTQLKEKILRPEQDQEDVVPPFNAFSAPGTPKGSLVYVNYARVEDFTWLKDNGHDISGYICIARYGKIFRGDKARYAQANGCIGLIIYSDPDDYAVEFTDEVYPDTWFLPGTGVQRGNVKPSSGGLGDPLTPGYPALKSAFRIEEKDTPLPKIPVHPIGYDDAFHLLRPLDGPDAPKHFQGKLNFTYKLGKTFEDPAWKIQMFISTKSRRVLTYNVFGIIEGNIEPDRYVLLGNHRDSWVFGSVDPHSGTASMKELSRAMGKLVREGWKPRRTIVFCSWGAEEFGIIGTREWVEHYGQILGDRAVAYLNVDSAVSGNFTMSASALPMLFNLMYESAKEVPNPDVSEVNAGRRSLYDTWALRRPELDSAEQPTGRPNIGILGSGSDFAPFIGKVGVSCIGMSYRYDSSIGVASYPLYHSVYETFHLYSEFIDPDFVYNKAVAQFWGELARRLADEYVLPFDVEEYGNALKTYEKGILDGYGNLIRENGHGQGLDFLSNAITTFKKATEEFQTRIDSADTSNPMVVRKLNDQMMQVERKFIDPLGLPGRPLTRNIVFAPSVRNSYAGASFPGLVDTLFEIEKATGDDKIQRWKDVELQLSVVTFFVENAASSLQVPTEFLSLCCQNH